MIAQNLAVLFVLYVLVRWVYWSHLRKTELRKTMAVLKRAGFKIYGSSGCGWCKKQLKDLGEFSDTLPFVDCAANPGECSQLGITGFPTWVDAKGTRYPGFKKLTDLVMMAQRA